MKKLDLITRPYDEFTDLMGQFFDRNLPLSKAFSGIKVDVQETDKEYTVEADLPGIAKEEIRLDLVDNYLLIDVEQKQETDQENKNYVRKERSYMSSRRSVYLPNPKKEGIDAKLENGVLVIHIPKETEPQKNSGIEIK